MTDAPLPDELLRLERALARRAVPAPPPHLRELALGGVRRERSRERRRMIAAALALAAAVLPLRPPPPDMGALVSARARLHESVLREQQALESLGYDATGANPFALGLQSTAIPALAPPIGSRADLAASLKGP